VLGTVAGRAGAAGPSSQVLVGTFKLTAGHVAGSRVTGSYFRMVYPGGTLTGGKFFRNPDSTTPDKTYTLVKPGTSGGLKTGGFQPAPTPTFDAKGNSRATSIIAPQRFAQLAFGLSTSSRDPVSGKSVPAPSIQVANGKLTGQVEALVASWNKLYFNQGSPKPGGTKPGLTSSVTGTYNAKTRAFVLEWASAIVGGPFNGFTGYWHLEGMFVPAH
jgi:hypothetical protein